MTQFDHNVPDSPQADTPAPDLKAAPPAPDPALPAALTAPDPALKAAPTDPAPVPATDDDPAPIH